VARRERRILHKGDASGYFCSAELTWRGLSLYDVRYRRTTSLGVVLYTERSNTVSARRESNGISRYKSVWSTTKSASERYIRVALIDIVTSAGNWNICVRDRLNKLVNAHSCSEQEPTMLNTSSVLRRVGFNQQFNQLVVEREYNRSNPNL
jgi:hypothetical protein